MTKTNKGSAIPNHKINFKTLKFPRSYYCYDTWEEKFITGCKGQINFDNIRTLKSSVARQIDVDTYKICFLQREGLAQPLIAEYFRYKKIYDAEPNWRNKRGLLPDLVIQRDLISKYIGDNQESEYYAYTRKSKFDSQTRYVIITPLAEETTQFEVL